MGEEVNNPGGRRGIAERHWSPLSQRARGVQPSGSGTASWGTASLAQEPAWDTRGKKSQQVQLGPTRTQWAGVTRGCGPREGRGILSQVRWEPLGFWDLGEGGDKETTEEGALLSKREQLPGETVGRGQIWGCFRDQHQRPPDGSCGRGGDKTGPKAGSPVPGLVSWRRRCTFPRMGMTGRSRSGTGHGG